MSRLQPQAYLSPTMSYESPTLQSIPDIVTSADREKLSDYKTVKMNRSEKMLLYEELVQVYDSHPYFLVRLAEILAAYRSGSLAMDAFRQTQACLLQMGIVDNGLDKVIETYGREMDDKVNADLAAAGSKVYYQVWKPTKQHKFPTNLPHCPPGHQELKDQWTSLTSPSGSQSADKFYGDYLLKLIVETNHLEGTFLITEESVQDIIRRGIADADIRSYPESALHDASEIKAILNDTLAACELLLPLVDDPSKLDLPTLCLVHKTLMRTCRFSSHGYTSPGVTRSTTRKTVIVAGSAYSVQCCPFAQVDAELDGICNLAKQWIKSWRNPFATASWIHLVLVRCHPFEDGNGRLTRLIASISLMRYGYPPICIGLAQRVEYYDAINKAYTGDHSALAACILQGMREGVEAVKAVRAVE